MPNIYHIFGDSLGISGDYAIVGTDEGNHAYIYKNSGWKWAEQPEPLPESVSQYSYFGCSVAISGDYAVVGAEGYSLPGAAYLFRRGDSGWKEQGKLAASDGVPYDHFGSSLSTDGNHVIAGASEIRLYQGIGDQSPPCRSPCQPRNCQV